MPGAAITDRAAHPLSRRARATRHAVARACRISRLQQAGSNRLQAHGAVHGHDSGSNERRMWHHFIARLIYLDPRTATTVRRVLNAQRVAEIHTVRRRYIYAARTAGGKLNSCNLPGEIYSRHETRK